MIDLSKRPDGAAPLDIALRLTTPNIIALARERLRSAGVIDAIAQRDPARLFDWLVEHFALQGVSDRAATTYQAAHGRIRWSDVQAGLRNPNLCPRLRHWWHFQCGYRKTSRACAEPNFFESCGLPKHDLRKGVLNEAAYGLALFIRDVCDGDLVSWMDQQLLMADRSFDPFARGRLMADALVDAVTMIPGTGPKVWSMLLADLLLGSDPTREHWVAAGASMIAVDTLVHAWLHRTGTLQRDGIEHTYGPKCHVSGGCVDVIERIAQTVDARAFNPTFPAYFPRFVQVAIWEFCAEGARNVCNGRQIDDRYSCRQVFCPTGPNCARRPASGSLAQN